MEQLLNLQELAGGALQEKVNEAMEKVLENMQDPNTPWKKQRTITIKLTFSQDEDRTDADVALSVATGLAPISPVVTRMLIGRNLKTGENYVREYGKQVRGQLSLDDLTKEEAVGTDAVDLAGEEVSGKVVDLRAREA